MFIRTIRRAGVCNSNLALTFSICAALVATKLCRAIREDVRFFLVLALGTQALAGGLDPYARLVLADSPGAVRGGLRVTYLGTNGYEFELKGHALLVDPYFSRVDLLSVALGSRIEPNASRINDGLRHLAR